MTNIGVGETYLGYLIKAKDVANIDTLLSALTPTETILTYEVCHPFKYRYLSEREMTNQPISSWLKGQYQSIIFTSEIDYVFEERDRVFLEDNKSKYLVIENVIPQKQLGQFVINKKYPHILELK
jgi:hypothetical protein